MLAWPVYGLCAFLPLSIAGVAVFKLICLLTGLAVLLTCLAQGKTAAHLRNAPTVIALLMLAALTLSLSYTSVPLTEAVSALTKYGKLLLLPAIAVLIRSRQQAVVALSIYFLAQSFGIITSWMLYFGIPLAGISAAPGTITVAFSSSLDQAIMAAGFTALAWHLRKDIPLRYGDPVALVLISLTILNVLIVLPGRTGHICLLAVLSMLVWWAVPRHYRLLALLMPILIFVLALQSSPRFNERYSQVLVEVDTYQKNGGVAQSSSGDRLNYWKRSIQAIAQQPLHGHGVGTWQQQYLNLENNPALRNTFTVRNPHQEYLFWGVQLGIPGILLLLAWMLSFMLSTRNFTIDPQRATLSLLVVFMIACGLNSALFDGFLGDYFCTLFALMLVLGHRSKMPE